MARNPLSTLPTTAMARNPLPTLLPPCGNCKTVAATRTEENHNPDKTGKLPHAPPTPPRHFSRHLRRKGLEGSCWARGSVGGPLKLTVATVTLPTAGGGRGTPCATEGAARAAIDAAATICTHDSGDYHFRFVVLLLARSAESPPLPAHTHTHRGEGELLTGGS